MAAPITQGNLFDLSVSMRKTVAIVVIGDEILRGQTLDTNSHSLCKTLRHSLNMSVQKIVVVPDVVDRIAAEVSSLSSSHDYVITTGGIGPTHDDITYEAVSQAFKVPLVRDASLVQWIDDECVIHGKHDAHDDYHPAYKMSMVPENSRVVFGISNTDDDDEQHKHRFPLVSVDNVYMLPGVPEYLERCLPVLVEELRPHSWSATSGSSLIMRSLYLSMEEVTITKAINDAVHRFRNRVSFGSYPSASNNYYKVQITMEAPNEEEIAEADSYMRSTLPAEAIVRYDSDAIINAGQRLYDHLDSTMTSAKLADQYAYLINSVRLLEDCLRNRYKPSEICISFNGGKDCTVLLHLYSAVLQHHRPMLKRHRITAFYVECSDPFSEVDQFMKETLTRYNLDLFKVPGPIKSGLKELLGARPNIKAILMGNRRTDPYCDHLQQFQETDPGWPKVIRVLPLLDWSYSSIWQYMRQFYIPYCVLYDRGYTSLGSRHNTAPNPNLKYTLDGIEGYHPAYTLDDQDKERNGRYRDPSDINSPKL